MLFSVPYAKNNDLRSWRWNKENSWWAFYGYYHVCCKDVKNGIKGSSLFIFEQFKLSLFRTTRHDTAFYLRFRADIAIILMSQISYLHKTFLMASLWRGVCHATYLPMPSSRSFSRGGRSIQRCGILLYISLTARFISTSLCSRDNSPLWKVCQDHLAPPSTIPAPLLSLRLRIFSKL